MGYGYDYIFYDNSAIDLSFSDKSNFIILTGQKTNYSNKYYKTSYLDSLIIDGKMFYNTYIVEKDTLKTEQDIWKAIIAENYGLIQFEDKSKRKIFRLKI